MRARFEFGAKPSVGNTATCEEIGESGMIMANIKANIIIQYKNLS
jgi:hypothetical protein